MVCLAIEGELAAAAPLLPALSSSETVFTDNATTPNFLKLHLIPLLQIINLILTLLHALLMLPLSAAPSPHRLRHLLPVAAAEVAAVQQVELLRVRLQQTRDRRVAPFFAVLRVIGRWNRIGGGFELLVVVGAAGGGGAFGVGFGGVVGEGGGVWVVVGGGDVGGGESGGTGGGGGKEVVARGSVEVRLRVGGIVEERVASVTTKRKRD